MLGNILLLGSKVLAYNTTGISSTCLVIADSLEVIVLALLGNYKSSAIILELYNPAIKFEVIVRGKLLILLG